MNFQFMSASKLTTLIRTVHRLVTFAPLDIFRQQTSVFPSPLQSPVPTIFYS